MAPRKGDVKGHFPLTGLYFWEGELKKRKKRHHVEEKRKKKGEELLSPAIESASVKKKAQPCKISVEVGGGPQQQCAFFLLRRSLKELPLSLLSPPHLQHPPWGRSTIHGANWSRERYVTMKSKTWNTMKERLCVCVAQSSISLACGQKSESLFFTTINRRNCNDTHHSLICHVQFTVRDLWVNRNHHVLLLSATRYSCKQRSAWPLCTSETVC